MKNKKLIAHAIAAITGLLIGICIFSSCGNMQAFDTTFKFDKAIIFLPNGESIEGEIDSWIDFENSDMIQVKIDGVTYLTHATNVIMISE
jgi:hypothetical protein